jgi:hypothetical protein
MLEARKFLPTLKRRLLKRLEFSNKYLKNKEGKIKFLVVGILQTLKE